MSDLDHDHVRLILTKDDSDAFYFDIPLVTIHRLILTPRKYLLYLGWDLGEIDSSGDLEGGVIYYLVTEGEPDMAVVDLEVIKLRTDVPSETTGSRDGFREKLLRRDQRCVYTGIHAELGDGLHLITYKRGSEWFRLIIENRPHEHNDNIRGLVDISDVRNGIFATKSIHTALEGRKLAILKTPNRILDVDDVSPSPDRSLSDEVAYPPNGRYMAQWLTLPSGMSLVQGWLPDNADATLGKHIRTNRPSDLLLHYNYGAAVIENLAERPPDPIRSGKSRALHYRKLAIKKAEAAAKAKKKKTSAGGSKRDTGWDEDDIMLFLGAIQGPQKNATLKSVKQKRRILKSGGKA